MSYTHNTKIAEFDEMTIALRFLATAAAAASAFLE